MLLTILKKEDFGIVLDSIAFRDSVQDVNRVTLKALTISMYFLNAQQIRLRSLILYVSP